MNRLALVVVTALSVCLPLSAQSVTVQFTDGQLEVQRGGGWSLVDAGAELAADSVVRLAPGSHAELAQGQRVITLSRPGTYRLPDLFKAAGAASSWGMSSVVSAKLSALAGTRAVAPQSAQMGARGSAQGNAGITWVEDEAGEMVRSGIKLLADGRTNDALSAFQQAADGATDRDTEAAARFYAAYVHDQLGQSAQAIRLIARVSPAATVDYYRDFVLLKSRLLIESAAPADALPLIDGYLSISPAGDGAQAAHVLAAFALRALGDSQAARARLQIARDIAPASELGKKANALIGEMR